MLKPASLPSTPPSSSSSSAASSLEVSSKNAKEGSTKKLSRKPKIDKDFKPFDYNRFKFSRYNFTVELLQEISFCMLCAQYVETRTDPKCPPTEPNKSTRLKNARWHYFYAHLYPFIFFNVNKCLLFDCKDEHTGDWLDCYTKSGLTQHFLEYHDTWIDSFTMAVLQMLVDKGKGNQIWIPYCSGCEKINTFKPSVLKLRPAANKCLCHWCDSSCKAILKCKQNSKRANLLNRMLKNGLDLDLYKALRAINNKKEERKILARRCVMKELSETERANFLQTYRAKFEALKITRQIIVENENSA